MVWDESACMVLSRFSATASMVLKYLFANPAVRISRQICSIGFISGVYCGMNTSSMFLGVLMYFDLCHTALSQARRILSLGYLSDSFFIKALNCLDFVPLRCFFTSRFFRSPFFRRPHFRFEGLIFCMSVYTISPLAGSIAPNTVTFSRTL